MSDTKNATTSMPSEVPIPIRGRVYKAKGCYLKQDTLKFYPDNPRVYSVLHDEDGKVPTQDEIEEHLQTLDHVRELREDIREHGGLIEPLYVKEVTLEVVEGNSRLAAYRLLADENAVKWERVKCAVLPKDVSESAIASLLGTLHLKGKKDWRPYEQASFLHRRHKKDKVAIPALVREFNISDKAIKHRINVIDFMIKHNDNTIDHWSYYDVFLKSRRFKKVCEDHADCEQTIVDKIKSGEIPKAADLRDKLKVVCGTKSEKPIKQLLNGDSLEDAFRAAQSLGGDHSALQRVKRFRTWIVDKDTKQAVKSATGKVQEEMIYELHAINGHIAKLLKLVK